jgi:hypothetical protein
MSTDEIIQQAASPRDGQAGKRSGGRCAEVGTGMQAEQPEQPAGFL